MKNGNFQKFTWRVIKKLCCLQIFKKTEILDLNEVLFLKLSKLDTKLHIHLSEAVAVNICLFKLKKETLEEKGAKRIQNEQ